MERLKLQVSEAKTKVVNVKRGYSDFLGFKIKVHPKSKQADGTNKYVIKSHISDKNLNNKRKKLVEQAKRIAKPSEGKTGLQEIILCNQMFTGMQNYYRIATYISKDCAMLNQAVMVTLTNRLKGSRLAKKGRELTKFGKEQYGKSAMLRFVAGTNEPVYPIGFAQHKKPMARKRCICSFTPEGRKALHCKLRTNTTLMYEMMRQPLYGRSVEYADNRISLFSAQWDKCSVTGREFLILEDIHYHHINPCKNGGTDKYGNLTLILAPVHRLIHATDENIIHKYLKILGLNKSQKSKLNKLRIKAGNTEIK